ncbi:hypothetical protein JCM9140_270 [Halalkalibacter wakoensis JCM 9140]|uniref:DUF2680 domain-containing protein n=1 Tax=Halalkalibacter wakoensis JCM 9140 TaxID=1236970 RepID=W4PYZ5_9BACI|nr:YckD family protein [Halalkalibacter wakoensis]GAE24354.1 hypothetical protein JCM9140_270 [Halalkalibacter wakoensis JCM 9140]
MKKLIVGLCIATSLTVGVMPAVSGAEQVSEVKLTDVQKEEMATLQKDAFAKKKEIINKYVEYGVFTKEKGEKIIQHMDKHYKMLEENDFVPKWDKKHNKHQSE